MKTADADETRRRKARELRYRKPVARDIHFDMIRQELWDIMEECDYVRYCFEDDGDSLVNALDGDGKEAYEFKRIGRYESRDKVSHDYCCNRNRLETVKERRMSDGSGQTVRVVGGYAACCG